MIKQGSVVGITYRLTNASGEELDRADAAEPFLYLHGGGQIIPGLENALLGLLVGAKKTVTVPPHDGYGEIDEALVTTVSRNNFPPGQDIEVGMRFAAESDDGDSVVFTVTDVTGDQISVDGNHPLAGETLTFNVEVLSVREATEEELAHGHAHHPGDGHHH